MAARDMSSIVDTIRNAVYGRDMREAIAQGFEQVSESGEVLGIDKTLTLSNFAADAKVTGDRLADLQDQISNLNEGLTREEKDALLAYFVAQVDLHPELESLYEVILNLWNKPVTSIKIDKDSITVAVGMTTILHATVLPEDAYDKTVTWSASPEGVVSVVNGTVMGIKTGSATITAKAGDKEDTCRVKVTSMTYYRVTTSLTSVTIDNEADYVFEGSSYSATLSKDSGYEFDTVKITMGGADITTTTFTKETGAIYIASVTGDIAIIASAVPRVYHNITYNLTGVSANPSPSQIEDGDIFNTILTVSDQENYVFKDIVVKLGQTDVSSTAIVTDDPTVSATIFISAVPDDISITANVEEAILDLNDYSWQQISEISSAGQAANYFSVGDEKEILLNGTACNGNAHYNNVSINVFIIGINHNASTEGNNLIHFMLGKKNGKMVSLRGTGKLDTKILTNDSTNTDYSHTSGPSNTGIAIDWTDGGDSGFERIRVLTLSNGKDIKNPTSPMIPVSRSILSCFPSELRQVMKKVTKVERSTFRGSGEFPVITYLFILSYKEVTGKEYSSQPRQSQYEYFSSGNGKFAEAYIDLSGRFVDGEPEFIDPSGNGNTIGGFTTRSYGPSPAARTLYIHSNNGDSYKGCDSRISMPIMPCFCV